MSSHFYVPKFLLPKFVARIGGHLPQWPHSLTLIAGLNLASKMNLLPLDRLASLEGRTFLIEVLDTGAQANFTYRDGRFRLLFTVPQTPDLIFRANLSTFIQMLAQQEDPDTLFFNRELSIEGDTELGLIVKNMLDAVEWPQMPRLPIFNN